MAIIDMDLQKLTPSLIGMILGAVLMLIAATGGGIRIKEIQVPSVSGPWRAISGLAAIVLLLFGFGILRPSSPPVVNPKQDIGPPATNPTNPVSQPSPPANSPGGGGTDKKQELKGSDRQNPAAPARHDSPRPAPCEINFTSLEARANHPDKPYMWHSYNTDLEALRNGAKGVINYLQTTLYVSSSRTQSCFTSLDNIAKHIQKTACTELARTGDNGRPVDDNLALHCGKNFEQFYIRLDGLKRQLAEKDFKVSDLDLNEENVGFDTWLDESAVPGADGKRL
jgi:hypothetical protein